LIVSVTLFAARLMARIPSSAMLLARRCARAPVRRVLRAAAFVRRRALVRARRARVVAVVRARRARFAVLRRARAGRALLVALRVDRRAFAMVSLLFGKRAKPRCATSSPRFGASFIRLQRVAKIQLVEFTEGNSVKAVQARFMASRHTGLMERSRPMRNLIRVLALAVAPLLFAPSAQAHFERAELEQMLAPIALYPDTVLSHVLIAATYPDQVEEAARWSRRHPSLHGEDAVDAVEDYDWDPSVKALVAFPEVLARMDEDPDWTERLGEAFLHQEPEVMDSVQTLRDHAYDSGRLGSLEHVRVIREREYIYIEPAVRHIVYVPYYDPWYVYGSWWWPAYPPYHWRTWGGHPASYYQSGFYWGIGFRIAPTFYFTTFYWPERYVVVTHRDANWRPIYSGRDVPRRQEVRHWREQRPEHAASGGSARDGAGAWRRRPSRPEQGSSEYRSERGRPERGSETRRPRPEDRDARPQERGSGRSAWSREPDEQPRRADTAPRRDRRTDDHSGQGRSSERGAPVREERREQPAREERRPQPVHEERQAPAREERHMPAPEERRPAASENRGHEEGGDRGGSRRRAPRDEAPDERERGKEGQGRGRGRPDR
jgi:hypothetical protein